MKTILVTGGIASGKSEVCRYLASKGLPVYDSDSRTKALYGSVPGLVERIEAAIGVPFAQIGVIFSDRTRREALEAVVYPEVIRDFEAWRAEQEGAETVFLESAIAAEKPHLRCLYDRILLIRAPLEERLKRNPKTAGRLSAQSPQSIRADHTIDNDGSLEALHKKIDAYLKTL